MFRFILLLNSQNDNEPENKQNNKEKNARKYVGRSEQEYFITSNVLVSTEFRFYCYCHNIDLPVNPVWLPQHQRVYEM